MSSAATRKPIDHDGPSAESLAEIPEVDFSRAKRIARPGKGTRRLVLPLSGMREACRKTQTEVAEAMDTNQPELSRLERRTESGDVLIATLQRYARAIGATCEVAFVFPTGHHIVLKVEP